MSLYPRVNNDFTNLFRVLDDYVSQATPREFSLSSPAVRTFSPKFDVKEGKDSYELHGELPGVEEKQVNIEFTEPQTIQISGRVETRQSSSSEDENGDGGKSSGYQKPAVEDENEDSNQNAVQRTDQGRDVVHRRGDAGSRWWITERAVGEFSRTFSFPTRVDQDNVTATLKNGVLKVVVPKAKKQETRKINIQS